jgi:hypothetical protein
LPSLIRHQPLDKAIFETEAQQALACARAARAALFFQQEMIRRRREVEQWLFTYLNDEAVAIRSQLEAADQQIARVSGVLGISTYSDQ